MIQMKGTQSCPLLLFCMPNEQVIAPIREMTEALLAEKPEYFLVDIRIKPTNNIKVFIDADNGAAIGTLASLNRQLYAQLEAAALYPDGDFSLEVSSPGLDEPLKTPRQFTKNIGRKVEVTKLDGEVVEGKLLSATEAELVLEETIGKKKELKQTTINLPEIKHTKVCIVF